jgi:hypothetical protein
MNFFPQAFGHKDEEVVWLTCVKVCISPEPMPRTLPGPLHPSYLGRGRAKTSPNLGWTYRCHAHFDSVCDRQVYGASRELAV